MSVFSKCLSWSLQIKEPSQKDSKPFLFVLDNLMKCLFKQLKICLSFAVIVMMTFGAIKYEQPQNL